MRKADPVVGVVTFFQTCPIDTMKTAFALVQDIVKKRLPAKAKPRVVKPVADRAVEQVG
jgi:hypothetical protein